MLVKGIFLLHKPISVLNKKFVRRKIFQNFSLIRTMANSALIILAPGAEEMELVISADVLRRADINVTVAGLNSCEPVKCSRDIIITPDTSFEAVSKSKFDVVVLPGGMEGSKAMATNCDLGNFLKNQEAEGRIVAAICAAPIALAAHNIFAGKKLTSYPSVKDELTSQYEYIDCENVVHDCNLITSRGPGTAFEFALKIVETLVDDKKSDEIATAMLLK